MFTKQDAKKKNDFLEKAQHARQLRAEEKIKEKSALVIQATVRRFLCIRRLRRSAWNEFDEALMVAPGNFEMKRKVLALTIFRVTKKLLFIYRKDDEKCLKRFQVLCRVILTNLEAETEPKFWYMSVMLSKDFTVSWIQQLKSILNICCRQLKTLKPHLQTDARAASLYLTMLVIFTDCSGWKILKMKGGENIKPVMLQLCANVLNDVISKGLYPSLQEFLINGLCKSQVSLNKVLLSAAATLSLRPLVFSSFSTNTYMVFILHVMSVPGFTLHLKEISPESLITFEEHGIFDKCLQILANDQDLKIAFNSLEGNRALYLLGNLVYLADLETEPLKENRSVFVNVIIRLLKHCQSYVVKKQSNLTKWHPILGWFKQTPGSSALNDAMPYVMRQLRLLWKQRMVNKLFESLPHIEKETIEAKSKSTKAKRKSSEKGLIKRAFGRSVNRGSSSRHGAIDLTNPTVADVCQTCELFQTLTNTLTQLRMDIIAGLSLQEEILVRLWKFLYSLGPDGGLKAILSYLTGNSNHLAEPLNALLSLFFECCSQLLPILDDFEFYEEQKPFTLEESVKLSAFLNSLVFKLIWNERIPGESKNDPKNDKFVKTEGIPQEHAFLNITLTLLLLLYDRDCRRSFTPAGHWLIRELKVSQFLGDLESDKRRALTVLQRIPHVIPHFERVKMFRRLIESDKESLGICKETSRPSALVTVHRSRLLEDGYDQLSRLTGQDLKGVVRVKFVNEQGLDEAGIDQDGVFKEFLEDTIKRAFDPQLNLFKMTSGDEQRLYPSSTSFIHDNHLALFEFVGKMLGKSVYEGILVDVPFAYFFLNQLLNRQHSILYSSIDELPSLDSEMYKSLRFIKNYEDVDDLELNFSFDEDVLGQVVTHDLKPGGRAIKVSNSNKVTYIHLMARFRMYTHIKEQSTAFIRGFRSIINPDWLGLFSPPEAQRLISGDTGDIDFDDLKKNTQYYGGYHPGHPVINWFWDILQHDLNSSEKGLFLKFVTSCSKPPLLGFKYLEPPFAVRFVECADDDDTGDSMGSVVRGFFNIRRGGKETAGRLPTASTCFNLLKLPNYKKKNTLKEKLRYSIHSGAGFELS